MVPKAVDWFAQFATNLIEDDRAANVNIVTGMLNQMKCVYNGVLASPDLTLAGAPGADQDPVVAMLNVIYNTLLNHIHESYYNAFKFFTEKELINYPVYSLNLGTLLETHVHYENEAPKPKNFDAEGTTLANRMAYRQNNFNKMLSLIPAVPLDCQVDIFAALAVPSKLARLIHNGGDRIYNLETGLPVSNYTGHTMKYIPVKDGAYFKQVYDHAV